MKNLFKAHPWHGISFGPDAPRVVTTYIEILPTDVMKYEIDKESGHLRVDRPQKYSNQSPTLYGFIPRTYCGNRVGEFCAQQAGRANIRGDGDPLDICVLTERPIQHGDILVRALPIGGLRMIDKNEADDKIIAVLEKDDLYGAYTDVSQLPSNMIERLRHYFLTYKDMPGEAPKRVEIVDVYGAEDAYKVIQHSIEDYRNSYS